MAELNLRTSAYNAITRAKDRVSGATFKNCDMAQLEQELKSLKNHFDRFVHNHEALVGKASETELGAHDALWEQMETSYNEACVILNRKMKELCAKTTSPKQQNLDIKLDPVTIPSFDGSFANWLAFKDVFETLVHDVEFPEAYKLSKLRQAVSAANVPLVGGLYSGGYEEVWAALKKRFDNEKLLCEIHVSRFINMKTTVDETAKALLAVVDTVQESLRALKVMKLPVDQWDALAVPIVVAKLPSTTRREWCMNCESKEIPKLQVLLDFLEKRAHSLSTEMVRAPQRLEGHSTKPSSRQRQQPTVKSFASARNSDPCVCCKGLHKVAQCPTLFAMKPEQRFEALKNSGLCYNCLGSGHNSRQCSGGRYQQCGRKHNTLFCRGPSVESQDSSALSSRTVPPMTTPLQPPPLGPTDRVSTYFVHGKQTVLLATARVLARGLSNEQRLVRILCDPGRRDNCVVNVEGIGALAHIRTKGSVQLELKSTSSQFVLPVKAMVIPTITSIIPAVHVDMGQWKHLVGLQLADPSFGTPSGIDVLLGSDVWGSVVLRDVIYGKDNEPHAQQTQFGWVVFGPASTASPPTGPFHTYGLQAVSEDINLEELVKNFWALEEVPRNNIHDDECERIFSSTHSRSLDGRYIVKIPFRSDMKELGNSYRCALRQFYCLERRLLENNELREKYISFMREYLALGHMEYVGKPCDNMSGYFIPHHAVITKFRVVFNASARTSTGVSLNDNQMVGPTIQEGLLNIIFRFRRFFVALTADVEKMFRQVLIAPSHRQFQRILWRESHKEEIGVYNLTTVTYGMACSPFNAIRSLHQCAYDNYGEVVNHQKALEAKDAIVNSFYVDDFLTSCDTIEDAVCLATNVDKILSAGHFKLCKWNSNRVEVLQAVTGKMCSQAEHIIDNKATSVLGLKWNPAEDELFFSVNLSEPTKYLSKRRVLSEVAQLFDPTGLLAPVIIIGKVFIQTLWSAGISWDAPLPGDLSDTWLTFRNGLQALNKFRVPRWLGMVNGESTTIHGFCDASLKAYAACIYIKTSQPNGRPAHISLLTARTKVAPLKGATIPRLELCAAHLLALTFQNAREALGLTNAPYYLWTDSTIVLCWLRKHPSTLKPFVSNRVQEIQNITSPERWHHVRSELNPADCASRGIGADAFLNHHLWLNGPKRLMDEDISFEDCKQLSQEETSQVASEEKVSLHSMVGTFIPELTTRMRDGTVIALTDRFSSLPRLLRTVAYMMRWLPGRRHLRKRVIINPEELDNALFKLILLEQGKFFSNDVYNLRNTSRLASSSRLLSLNPFLDEKGVLRVGGRLGKAPVSHDYRFPIILPKKSMLSSLLISNAHETTLHGGVQVMLQTLRSRFWMLHARQAVRTFIHQCVTCRRHRGAILSQQMASLPKVRVTAARPFISSGLDYCGPFKVRVGTKRSRSTVKAYLAIFICIVTKAVHIEVVDDLTSQAFLDAFTRFISRRGPCQNLYSDNGTSFIGANRILQEIWQLGVPITTNN